MVQFSHITFALSRDVFTRQLVWYLMWKVQGGTLSSISALDSHQKGHRRVQQVVQMCRDDGQVDVLPLEREEQGSDAL